MAVKIFVCLTVIIFVGQSLEVPLGNARNAGSVHHFLSRAAFTRPVARAPTALRSSRAPVANIFQQRLDHVDSGNSTTWNQTYFVNEQFYATGGPIFVMMSLEGAADPEWLRGGQMMELALLYKAKAFLLEERFYGQSRPTPDTSVENLRYATPEENVGDLALFISWVKSSHPGAKVIVFGGSYGGSHVVWAKQQHPQLIDGAVVSSSPLLAVYGFPEFMAEVTRVLSLADEACVADLEEALTAVEEILFESKTGGETVADLFNLCAPLDESNLLDVSNFFRIFPDTFVLAVETASSLSVVQDTCNLMTNPLYGATPLDRLIELRNTLLPPSGCTEVRYDTYLPIARNTSWDNPAGPSRNYMYETCSFYGDFPSSDSEGQPFGDHFPMDVFVRFCADVYSPRYDATFIQNSVDATNAQFGGLTPDVANTVFVQGSLDPWRVLGVQADLSDTATAIVIEGTSHITDMRTASASDSQELTAAREKIRDLVGQWIS